MDSAGSLRSEALQRALERRFALLEKSRIHRIAEKCFASEIPPVRNRIIIAKGLHSAPERAVNAIRQKEDPSKVTYHPIDPCVIENYNKWFANRKALREDLNHLGDYSSWIKGSKLG